MHRTSCSHSFGESNHHLQFTPKYRRPVFSDPEIMEEVKQLTQIKANQLGILLIAQEFGPDHQHMFVARCKNYSDAKLANEFKGFVSRKIRQKLSHKLAKFKLGKSFWSDGYFFEIVGLVTAEHRKFYIERCQKKHWVGTNYIKSKDQTQLTKFIAG